MSELSWLLSPEKSGLDESDQATPVRGKRTRLFVPLSEDKQQRLAGSTKRKREEDAKHQSSEVQEAAEELKAAILTAAPSPSEVLGVIKNVKCKVTLANAISKVAISANAFEKEMSDRVATLWPSIEKQLQSQMSFSRSLRSSVCRKALKLEVPMVPEEAPKQWLNQYKTNGCLKEILIDSEELLKFSASVQLTKKVGIQTLIVFDGLAFSYCKITRKLTITGKYGLEL